MLNFSKKYKVFFVHIPKNAGTSINHVLEISKAEGGHNTFRQIEQEVGPAIEKYPSIGVVRNPWDRMVSLYKFRKSKGHDFFLGGNDYSFEEWLFNPLTPAYSGNMEWTPQLFSLMTNNLATTYTLKFEKLEQGWDELSTFLSLPKELPRLNTTDGETYKEYYTQKSIDLVARLFEPDISYFGYSF